MANILAGILSGTYKKFKDMEDGSHAEVIVDGNGKAGVTITTGTGAVTGTFTAIQCITDTVFTTLTETGATGSLGSTTIPAGITLFGNFTAYTLASGVVRAYA